MTVVDKILAPCRALLSLLPLLLDLKEKKTCVRCTYAPAASLYSHVHVRAEKTAFQLSSARLNCRLDPAAAMFTRDGRPDGGDPSGCHAHMPGDRRPPVLTVN
uniref:Uncharacterized protein n=1 Tax=Oryza meridionalis TaxID=40149 RepID=A0A0E0DQR0_9ORYZ